MSTTTVNAPVNQPAARGRGLLNALPTTAAVLILVLMFAYGQMQYGKIIAFNTLSNLVIENAHLIILALGLTFVILTGGIDLSVGAVVAVSSVAGVMMANAGVPVWICVIVTILIGTLSGTIAGVLIQYFNVQPFIATLAMMFLARGVASMLSTTPQRLDRESGYRWFGEKYKIYDGFRANDLNITPSVIIMILLVLVCWILLRKTRMGRTVYAIGGAENSAQLMGLPVARTKLAVYIISGTLAGIASVMYTARIGTAQNVTGVGWELNAIAAVVIGGTMLIGGYGFIWGSVVGALVLGLLNLLITRDGTVRPELVTIITGVILLIFVLLQRAVSLKRKTT
jgi:ribose/xylose/arabinose/galactoside ABC-type transport system permease subunit